jgi:hypothetical protein
MRSSDWKDRVFSRQKVALQAAEGPGGGRPGASVAGGGCATAAGGSLGGGGGVVRSCVRSPGGRSSGKRGLPVLLPSGSSGGRRVAGRAPAAWRDRMALLELPPAPGDAHAGCPSVPGRRGHGGWRGGSRVASRGRQRSEFLVVPREAGRRRYASRSRAQRSGPLRCPWIALLRPLRRLPTIRRG